MRKLGTLVLSGAVLAALTVPAGAFFGSPARQIDTELPDPNTPNAPAVVTIDQGGVPTAFVRVENPAPADEEDLFAYIPEDEVPLDAFDIEDEDVPLVGSSDDGTSADGFGGAMPSIDVTPGADSGMSDGGSGGIPMAAVAGGAVVLLGGGGIALAAAGSGAAAGGAAAAGSAAAGHSAAAGGGKSLLSKLLKIFRKKP